MRRASIRKAVSDYLVLRRRLGFQLEAAGVLLGQFADFMEQERAPYITTDLALRWARQPANGSPPRWSRRLGIVRRFATYWCAFDPRTEIPPRRLLPSHYRRPTPHVFSDEDVSQLFTAASRLRSPLGLRASTYSTLFGLLAVTGMRRREATSLTREDVALATGLITIRGTKFKKSRLVPVHPTTLRALKLYAKRRDRLFPHPKTDRFFVGECGTPLGYSTVDNVFRQLLVDLGFRQQDQTSGPSLHGLRHRFAIRTLVDWYRAEVDVEHLLPRLSTYLGHTKVSKTYWYLSAVPELLQLAVARVEKRKQP